MNYTIEKYADFKRFNQQYEEIYHFLSKTADTGYNEHFHWGRFEWMMCHSMLDVKNLDKIALFRDEKQQMVGLVTYDTEFDGSAYLIHATNDEKLLKEMLDFAVHNYGKEGCVAVNSKDALLCQVLREEGYEKRYDGGAVLQINLDNNIDYHIPEGYRLSEKDFVSDNWKYQMVIHRGFNHDDIPEKWDDELFLSRKNFNEALNVFALKEDEYCAYCGVWYTSGDTAYIEPVVTVPEYRNLGLARAVVYEAIARAKEMGAKRAVVLSEQEFYFKLGFERTSEVAYWGE